MAKIYLVRHGESIANTESIYQGQTYDTDLSPLGIKQVEALAEAVKKLKLTKLFTSPLKRTFRTAEKIQSNLDIPLYTDQRILETSHGQWEGKHKEVIVKTWPEIYKKWLKFPSSVKFPDGEHFLDTQKRVLAWWDSVKEENEDVLAVTHDNIIRILVAKVLNMKLNRIWSFHLQPTSITLIETGSYSKLHYLNKSEHLVGLQANLALHAL